MLDQHDKAWTADAGGQQDAAAPDSPPDGQQQPTDATAALAALVAGPLPIAPPATAPVTDTHVTSEGAPPAAVASNPLPAAGQLATTAAAAADATVAATADALPDAAPASDADAAPGVPQAPVGDPAAQDGATADGGSLGQGGDGAPKGDGQAGRQALDGARAALAGLTPASSEDAPATPTVPTTPAKPAEAGAVATATVPDRSADAAPTAPATDAPTTPAVTPATHAAPRGVSAPAPVPVAHAPAALADLVQVAHERGAGQARMVLHPESLGGVEVHLRQTAEGIRATVHVHHPEALQVLQAGIGDLRRGLEERGVTIDQLDLGLAPGNDDGQQRNGAARGDGGLGARAGATGLSGVGDGAADDETLTTPNATTTQASAGVLVDVMA